MKNPNRYGSITKLTGNRRRPFMVRVSTGKEFDFEKKLAEYDKLLKTMDVTGVSSRKYITE